MMAGYTKFRRMATASLFLGPATLLVAGLLVLPILLDLVIAFTDMAQTIKVTEFSATQFSKLVKPSADAMFGFELRGSFQRALTRTFVFVGLTLLFFNIGLALLLALATTALPDRLGSLFRAIWLLPRMSPTVVYALLWLWVIDPTERGLFNQVLTKLFGMPPINLMLDHPMALMVMANGLVGASLGMIILTSAIRSIPDHLFHAARVDGATTRAVLWHIVLPALRWPLSYITIFQTLALLVSFEIIFLIMGTSHSAQTMAVLAYTKSLAPGTGGGQYAYGAAITMILIILGLFISLALWRLSNMRQLVKPARIEVH